MSTAPSSIASRLGNQALFFLCGNIFTLLLGLPLQIYVARQLGTAGLGTFGLLEGGMGLAAGLLALGLAPTLVRFIPAHLEHQQYQWIRKLLRLGLCLLLFVSFVFYLGLVLGLPLLLQWFPLLAEYRIAVLLMGILVPLSMLSYYLQQGLRGFQEIRYIVTGNSFLQLAVKAGLTILLLSAGFGLLGYVWAVVLSVLVAMLWMSLGLRRKILALPADDAEVVEAPLAEWRAYAKVMYSGSLLGMGGAYLDRFLLALVAGAHPVGILLVLKQLQQMPVIFLQMFLSIASPMFAAAHARGDQQEIRHIYHLTTDWVVRLSAPLLIFFAVFAEPLLQLYGDDFAADGVLPFRILLLSQLVNLGFGPIGQVMYMSGLEKTALRIALWQTLFNAACLLLLVPLLGLTGVALTIFGSVVFINVAEYFSTRKHIGLRWGDRRYIGWILPSLLCAGVALLVQWQLASISIVVLVAMLALLYAVFHGVALAQGLHADDRQLLASFGVQLGLSQGKN